MEHFEKNLATYDKLFSLQEEYNRHTNITRISTREDFYTKHIKDSLSLLEYLHDEKSLIDIGTGGGYPGIPLAIERPETQIVLNDATLKKTKYLDWAIQELGLTNVSTIWARAEKLGTTPDYQNKFDGATARAVGEIELLLGYMAPLIKIGGRLYLLKAKTATEEITKAEKTAQRLGLSLENCHSFQLGEYTRTIVVYKKA